MDSVNEFVIEWLRGQKTASLTIPSNTHMKNLIMKLAEKHPNVSVLHNKDGSIFAHVPVEWITIKPPKQLSEEHKAKIIGNLKRGNK